MSDFEKTFGNGRPLTYSLEDYWHGVSGEGELAYQWEDKPHRLVFDLIDGMLDARQEIARLKAERDEYRARAEKAEAALNNISALRFGLQSVYEDYPFDGPKRWRAERDYWHGVVDRDLRIAHEALAGRKGE